VSDDSTPAEIDEVQAAKAANRFDIRRLIGGLFVVYGVILVIIGVAGSSATKHKAAGINIDLWAGIGMLLFAAFMLAWAFTRPTVPHPERAA
jgi:NADH:ubiquinone oxidoreductase subunit 4 (subunit M)